MVRDASHCDAPHHEADQSCISYAFSCSAIQSALCERQR
jgi:hypothetical protein